MFNQTLVERSQPMNDARMDERAYGLSHDIESEHDQQAEQYTHVALRQFFHSSFSPCSAFAKSTVLEARTRAKAARLHTWPEVSSTLIPIEVERHDRLVGHHRPARCRRAAAPA